MASSCTYLCRIERHLNSVHLLYNEDKESHFTPIKSCCEFDPHRDSIDYSFIQDLERIILSKKKNFCLGW